MSIVRLNEVLPEVVSAEEISAIMKYAYEFAENHGKVCY